MEGTSVLVTDFQEGACFSLLEFLIEKKAVPFVLIKDFENIQNVLENFPAAIPIVLDLHHSMESTTDHLSALPTMSSVFNFHGEALENLFRQTFEHFHKTITVCTDQFDGSTINNEIVEANLDGYTLIINFLTRSVSPPLNPDAPTFETNAVGPITAITTATDNTNSSSRNLKFIFEKLFSRHPEVLNQHKMALRRSKDLDRQFTAQSGRESNPISELFRKMFSKFNPCATLSVLNILPARSRDSPIKSPEEINKYVKAQENHEIKVAFQTIHESALRNWAVICEEAFQLTPSMFEERFATMCEEIERKGEEGRKVLLDKVNKDIERTKQWDHVLGAKTIERLRTSREREIENKVQHFCKRKIAEARQNLDKDFEENKNREKTKFYEDILEEQIMELTRIKTKYQKRRDLLMLPYTGELKILS